MSESANVKSISAIHDFKIALANFAEDARNALSSTEMEVRRARNWLLRDQLGFWQARVKKCNEEVSTTRTELHRRRLSQQGSDSISDTEQKENLRAAQRRLEEAERKVALCKKWAPILEHAISEYHSALQPLGDHLSGGLVNSMTLLDRMVTALESYLAVAPPPTLAAPTFGRDAGGPAASAGSAATSGTVATAPPPDDPAAVAGSDATATEPAEPAAIPRVGMEGEVQA